MSTLFNPDTLKDEYHNAFTWAVHHNNYDFETLKRLIAARKTHPQAYMSLAALAQEHGLNAFRLGVRIYLDLIESNQAQEQT